MRAKHKAALRGMDRTAWRNHAWNSRRSPGRDRTVLAELSSFLLSSFKVSHHFSHKKQAAGTGRMRHGVNRPLLAFHSCAEDGLVSYLPGPGRRRMRGAPTLLDPAFKQ